VWSFVRKFDEPQKYKIFVKRCVMREGSLEVGSVREIEVVSGLPATTSVEQLECLDDSEHILGMRKLDGDHRLKVCSFMLL
jgi:abscisic acid receptor PYR/PYL family